MFPVARLLKICSLSHYKTLIKRGGCIGALEGDGAKGGGIKKKKPTEKLFDCIVGRGRHEGLPFSQKCLDLGWRVVPRKHKPPPQPSPPMPFLPLLPVASQVVYMAFSFVHMVHKQTA